MIEETSNSKAQLDNGVRKFYFNLITAAFFSMRKKNALIVPWVKKSRASYQQNLPAEYKSPLKDPLNPILIFM